jgi:hypothetical protein
LGGSGGVIWLRRFFSEFCYEYQNLELARKLWIVYVSSLMKFPLLLIAVVLASVPGAVAQNAGPVLSFDFDSEAAEQRSTGTAAITGEVSGSAKIGGDGSGVSGKPGDRAYDNSVATGTASDGIFKLDDAPGARGLGQMTVALWYRHKDGKLPGEGARLADFGGNWLFFSDAPARLAARVPTSGPGQSAPNGSYPNEGWVFAAFSYDEPSGTVRYFRGTPEEPVVEVVARESFTERMKSNATPLHFGNNHDLNRAFAGWLDAIKVFDTALDAAQLEKIRQTDLDR